MTHKTILFSVALAFVGGFMGSCSQEKPTASAPAEEKNTEELKIAFVEVDSIMTRYQFCVDYAKVLQKKAEAAQNTLTQKNIAIQKEIADFQNKAQSGGFTSQEQFDAAQASIQKKQLQAQNLEQSLGNEIQKLQDQYNTALHDSLQSVLTEYNKAYGYTYILSKAGDNILLTSSKYDITDDIIAALNKRYKPAKEEKK